MTDEFRTIDAYPDFEISREGIVRRRARPSKMVGKPDLPARVLTRMNSRPNMVVIEQKWVSWVRLRDDTWGDLGEPEFDAFDPWKFGRPKPIEPGARVITLAEWVAICHP